MNNDQEQDRGEFAPAPTVFNDLTSLRHKHTVGPIESAMRERVLIDANGRKYITTEPFKPDYNTEAVLAEREACAKVCEPQEKHDSNKPVAWLDGPHLVMRSDWRDRANYKGPWVDFGRAIPDSWVPVLYTSLPAQRTWVGLSEQQRNDIEDYCEMMIGKVAFDAIEAKLRENN